MIIVSFSNEIMASGIDNIIQNDINETSNASEVTTEIEKVLSDNTFLLKTYYCTKRRFLPDAECKGINISEEKSKILC